MKTKKQELKITPFSITRYLDKTVYFCLVESEKRTSINVCEKNGQKFERIDSLIVFGEKGQEENLTNCEHFHVFNSGTQWYLVFSRPYSSFFAKKQQMVIARSSDMIHFNVVDRENNREFESLTAISSHRHKNHFLAYFGNSSIKAAVSTDLKNWHYSGKLLFPRKDYFDSEPLHVIDAIKSDKGILVLYESKPKLASKSRKIVIGGALFSNDQPYKILWRSNEAIFEKVFKGEKEMPRYLGSIVDRDDLETYWSFGGERTEKLTIKTLTSGIGALKKRAVHLSRHHNNPIIKPNAENTWEYDATFNPAAVHLEDKVHLIYRAIGANGVSVFGYASSENGLTVDERLDRPAFAAMNFSQYSKDDQALYPSRYVSGGSWIGCEDPRITLIEDRIYMTYTSFDGCNPPGVSLTWISAKDFLRKNWTWRRPVLISKPGEIQKNWMLFPEKINGKYAVLHSITPNISIEYIDDLEAEGLVIESKKMPGKDEHRWDNIVRGAGSPPIRTEHGWLVLYHAMDKKDPNKYKVGAMLLDYDDPTKVLYRANCPVLEPNESYENEGAKAGVVYVCGAIIKDDTLFVYYGGADSVVCVATADINDFLSDITCEAANDPIISKKIDGTKKIKKEVKKKMVKKVETSKKIIIKKAPRKVAKKKVVKTIKKTSKLKK